MKYILIIAFFCLSWQGFSQDTTDVEKPLDSLQVTPTDSLMTDSLNNGEITAPDSLVADTVMFRLVKKAFYEGGDTAFLRKVKENLQYPPEAREKKFQAKLIVKFVVSKSAMVTDVQIIEGFPEDIEPEFKLLIEDKVKNAIYVASEKGWVSARNNQNNAVAMRKTLPIIFSPYKLE